MKLASFIADYILILAIVYAGMRAFNNWMENFFL